MKHIVCFSGGIASALVAEVVVARYGVENTILLAHRVSPIVEDSDIHRYREEVAAALGMPITYANHPEWEHLTPLENALRKKGFGAGFSNTFCTYELKTAPFHRWLEENCASHKQDFEILYGFTANEEHRVSRKKLLLNSMGYASDYPLAEWEDLERWNGALDRIEPPRTYSIFKHANCKGCLKAGIQHWYVIFQYCPSLFIEAMNAEETLGHTIIKNHSLKELALVFTSLASIGVVASEYNPNFRRAYLKAKKKWLHDEAWEDVESDEPPCDCCAGGVESA